MKEEESVHKKNSWEDLDAWPWYGQKLRDIQWRLWKVTGEDYKMRMWGETEAKSQKF